MLTMMVVMLAVSSAWAEVPTADKDGFIPIFNGKDLEGWHIYKNTSGFKVQDGIIRCEYKGGGEVAFYKGRTFTDFVMEVEWRVSPKGNSGVFLRTPDCGDPWTQGYEVQISNEQPPRDDAHCTGSIYGYSSVKPRPDETPEQWRMYEITCKGDVITVKIDGKLINTFDQSRSEGNKDKSHTGYVGVQDSHSAAEDTWIEYRSIRVKPLD